MGIDDFDELVQAKRDLADAQRRNAALEKRMRQLVACGTRGNCPPDRGCAAGNHGNCRNCWLDWCGLAPLPHAGVKREREREDSEEQMICGE